MSTSRGLRGQDTGPPGGRRPGRWQRLGIAVVCLDFLIVGMVVAASGGARFPGIAVAGGGTDVDPVSYLGSRLDRLDCRSTALSIGEGLFVICDDWSAITTPGGTAEVVSLYAAGNPVIDEYTGTLPQALTWGETITDVADALGPPRRITDMYGSPTLVYMFDSGKYGSLELQFDEHDELVRINACLTR